MARRPATPESSIANLLDGLRREGMLTVLNNIVDDSQESGRFMSSVDAHTHAHVSVTDLPHF